MNLTPEDFQNVINATSDRAKIRVRSVKSEPAVKPGTNFCSLISRVELDVLLACDSPSTIRLIVKSMPPTTNLNVCVDFVKTHDMFPTEIKAYTWLSKTVSDPERRLWPKYFGSRENSFILLEDLKFDGYSTLGTGVALDYAHALLAVKELGKFHALSSTGEVPLDQFTADWVWSHEDSRRMFFTQPLTYLARTMKDCWGLESTTADQFMECASRIEERLGEMVKLREDVFNVVNHGDMWATNILFKHDTNGRPVSLKFVDFQLSSYNTFARDLTYFLYTSVEPETRRIHYKALVEAYRMSLTESLVGNGPDNYAKTTRNAILKEMRRLKFYGFLLLISIYAVTEARERVPFGTDGFVSEEGVDLFRQLYSSREFRKSVEEDLKYFSRSGIL